MGSQEPVSKRMLKEELDELNNGIHPRIVQTEVGRATYTTVARRHCKHNYNCCNGSKASFIFL